MLDITSQCNAALRYYDITVIISLITGKTSILLLHHRSTNHSSCVAAELHTMVEVVLGHIQPFSIGMSLEPFNCMADVSE